jgi:hypothetical protein
MRMGAAKLAVEVDEELLPVAVAMDEADELAASMRVLQVSLETGLLLMVAEPEKSQAVEASFWFS